MKPDELEKARRRFGKMKPMWSAIIALRRAGFSLSDAALIMNVSQQRIEDEWEVMKQNAT